MPPGTVPLDSSEPLSVAETALLAGGPLLLATSALVDLVEQRALAVRDTSVMVRGRRAPADEVGAALWQQLQLSGRTSVQRAVHEMAESPVVGVVEDRLAARGLLPGRRARRRRRTIRTGMALLGLGGLVAGILAVADDGPFVPIFVSAGLALACAALIPRPRRTAAGSAALDAARDEHAGLAAGGLPGERGRAVALFGVEVLGDGDPALALLLRTGTRTAPSLQEQVAHRRTKRRRAAARRSPAAGGSVAGWWGLGGVYSGGSADGGSVHGGHFGGHPGGGHSCGGGHG
jgi:uncharacterized protein (TIGR04222 family)